jgi:hypothetical protein
MHGFWVLDDLVTSGRVGIHSSEPESMDAAWPVPSDQRLISHMAYPEPCAR